jgi:hypothetical protein
MTVGRRRLAWSAALRFAALGWLLLMVAGGPAGAEPALGVNRTNLAWEQGWRAILDDLRRHEVKAVRLTLVEPWQRTAETIEQANRQGLDVLLNIPLSLASFYPPGELRRPGNGRLREIHRLSRLDMGRYEPFLARFLDELERRNVRLAGIEIGNEINWADFNGDLPLLTPGRIFSTADEVSAAAPDVLLGFAVYGRVVAATRRQISGRPTLAAVPLISAGFIDGRSPFVIQSGGTALSLRLTAQLLRDSGAMEQIDGLAVHVYPRVGRDHRAAREVIADAVGFADRFCAEMTKPCHLTEWGFARPPGCGTDPARARLFEEFVDEVRRSATIRSAYLFAWDESGTYGVFRCGSLVDGGAAIR